MFEYELSSKHFGIGRPPPPTHTHTHIHTQSLTRQDCDNPKSIVFNLSIGYKLSRYTLFLAAAGVIVPRYDMLKSISYDIYLGQDQNVGQDLGKNLHPPNISWIHDVNKTC